MQLGSNSFRRRFELVCFRKLEINESAVGAIASGGYECLRDALSRWGALFRACGGNLGSEGTCHGLGDFDLDADDIARVAFKHLGPQVKTV